MLKTPNFFTRLGPCYANIGGQTVFPEYICARGVPNSPSARPLVPLTLEMHGEEAKLQKEHSFGHSQNTSRLWHLRALTSIRILAVLSWIFPDTDKG